MKKMVLSLSLAAVAMLFAGCVSVETVKGADLNKQALSNTDTTVAHLNVQNWGIYLFTIPLVSGSTDEVGKIAFFKDTVNPASVTPIIAAESKKLGGTKLLDLASQYGEFGFIFVSRSINLSGNVVR